MSQSVKYDYSQHNNWGYENNPYYNPETHGLEQIALLEFSSGNYEYDTRVVWYREEDKTFWTARDSGCSCPTPFASSYLEPANYDELVAEAKEGYEWGNSDFKSDSQQFIEALRSAGLHTRKNEIT